MSRSAILAATAAIASLGIAATQVSASQGGGVVFSPVASSATPAPVTQASERARGITFTSQQPAKAAMNNTWVLNSGEPIDKQLAEWASRAGWAFEWKPDHAWIVPARAEYTGSFDEVIEKVFGELYAQGAAIKLNLWKGNNPPFAEIIDADVK